ncbi:MAG: hypothetical protein DMG48_02935 [Acidobacteria bacterium]|nr:MAG: hypothetical protein DMG48_02935 [Acidobacteriota bacterium]
MANGQSAEVFFKPEDFHPVDGEVSFAPSAFQPLDDKSEAPTSKPAPPELQTNLSLPSNASIGAYKPTVWDRVSRVFTEGIPSLSSRTVYNPKFGNTQILSPEESMTPAEQERHPVLTATGEVTGGFTSPQSIALIAGSGGLGEIGGAASKIIPRLISGGFAAQQIYDAAKKSPDIWNALKAGDSNRAEYLLTHAGLELGMAALGARHALGGKAAITGKTSEVPVETHAVDPQSPVGTLIQGQSAPDVRMVETEAQRTELERREQATGWKDIAPQRVNPQELEDVSQQLGRPVSESELPDIRRRTEAARNVEEGLRGNRRDVAGEIREAHRANLEGQNGNRVVADEHVPVVTKSEVLAERIQRMVDNSEELQKIGIDPAKIQNVDDVQAQLERAADHLKKNLDSRVTDTLTFDMQRQLASELNMSVEDLLSRKSGAPFNAEEVTAARSLLKASQARVLDLARKAASGEVENSELTNALSQHRETLDVVRGQVAREAGRALGAFRIADEDLPSAKIADLLSKLSPDQQQHAAELIAKTDPSNPAALNKLVSELTPSSNWDKLFEAWQNSLLSSPKTGIIKAASDATMLFLHAISKSVAGALSSDRSAIEGWSFAKGAANALGRAGRILLGGEDSGPGFEGSRERVGAIKGTLGKVVRFPMTVIGRISDAAHVINYAGELESLAYRKALQEGLTGQALESRQAFLTENPTPEMRQAAYAEAKRQTFQADLGKYGKATQRFIRTIPGLRYLAPFFKTPLNIAKQAAEYSPYGVAKGVARGNIDVASRGIVGSAIASAIAYHAMQGNVSGGGPLDFRKKQTLEATGWQPYSVKIAGKYYSYNRLEPVGMVAGLTADLMHAIHNGEDPESVGVKSKAEHIQAIVARNIEHLPFVNSLSNLMQALEPGNTNRIQRFVRNQASEVVPAIVAQTAQAIDPTVRRAGSIGEAIEAKLPGLTQNVPAVTDISGQPVRRPASAVGGMNPFPVSTQKNNPAVSEMARLGYSVENPPQKVTQPKAGLGLRRGEKAPSTVTSPEESRALQTQDAQMLTGFLNELVKNEAWGTMQDADKKEIIKHARSEIARTRWERLFRIRVASASRGSQ